MNSRPFFPCRMLALPAAFLLAMPPAALAADSLAASYTVTFVATWSAETHPQEFPPAPHFSSLTGVTHDADVSFWAPGTLASTGLKNVAELGNPGVMKAEYQAAINAGNAGQLISSFGSSVSPGSIAVSFEASQQHPLVTLITMVAPSPDWFVGVRDLPLRADGQWLQRIEVPLFAYDSGTDSGATFTAPNLVTVPFVPVALLDSFPLDNHPPLGSFIFTRTDAPSAWSDLGGALPAGGVAATLAGSGSLLGGSPAQLTLSGAPPDSTTILITGTAVLALPFKGGTLVPAPEVLLSGLATDAAGGQVLSGVWPAGVPGGAVLVFQQWWVEPAAVAGWAASNGVCAQAP